MQFTLKIELGNDRMRTWQDIRDALKEVMLSAGSCASSHAKPTEGDGAKIMDENGNSVGKWEVIEDAPAPTNVIHGYCVSDEELAAEREQLSPEDRAILDALPTATPAPVAALPNPLADASNLATTLAALRLFQKTYEDVDSLSIQADWPEHFSVNFDQTVDPAPLGTEDIDTLCEELNFGSVEDAYQTTAQGRT